MKTSLLDELQTLLSASIDAKIGYVEAIKDSKHPEDLTGLFERMALLHESNAQELARTLTGMNVSPDTNASIMSLVHTTIIDVRSLVGGLGKSVLPGLIDGEERNEKLFRAAIIAADQPSIKSMLKAQLEKIANAVAEMRSLSQI